MNKPKSRSRNPNGKPKNEKEFEEELKLNSDKLIKFRVHVPKKRYIELMAQLKIAGLKQNTFFAACIDMFIKNDPLMQKMLYDMRKKKYPLSNAADKIIRNIRDAAIIEAQYDLDENEVENIFDLIENDLPSSIEDY